MRRNADDTFDWAGFDQTLLNQDELDANQLIKDEQIDYAGKTHDYDILNSVAGVTGAASKLGGSAGAAVSGGKAVLSGIPFFDLVSGILTGVADYKKKKEDNEEAKKEQADAKKLKDERAQAPTNQVYGMSLRNSGI